MRKFDWNRESEWAENGRLDKAATLAAFIRANYPVNDAFLEALPLQSHEWWKSLVKDVGVNYPSFATMEACIGMLAAEMPMRSSV